MGGSWGGWGRQLGRTIYAGAGEAQLRITEILGRRRFSELNASLELLTKELVARRVASSADCRALRPGR